MLTIKIMNGLVIDGSGRAPRRLDVGTTGSIITEIAENLSVAEARHTIDADGCVVCPGFIDTHTHSDTYLLIEPAAPSKTHQGVTTEVVGNCGASAAPLAGDYQLPVDWASHEYPGRWRSVAEYRELLERAKPAPNVLLLIGHNTIRGGIMGYENRAARPDEKAAMSKLLEQALAEGGRGFSTGLVYPPGRFADKDEVVSLARVVAQHEGIYASHIRNESNRLIPAVDEAIAIGRDAGIRTQISHLKVSGAANWHVVDELLDKVNSARRTGLEVSADRYPYTSSCTDLDIVLPDWAVEGGRTAVLSRLRDADQRARLREELLAKREDTYWSTITIGSTSHPDNLEFQGCLLIEVAERLCMTPVDALLHLIETDELKTSAFFQSMSENNMLRILGEPYVMIGSDASLRATTGPLSSDFPHPRAYGSNAKFLRMALDGETVVLPEAIRKMTSLPAEQFRIKGRGTIRKGYKGDIVIFNPSTVRDRATYSNPHQLADGVEHVIANGVRTISNGRLTGSRAGEVL